MKCRNLLKISPFMEDSYLLGRLGEDTAVRFLEQKGFTIIARNYRFQKAEIDIIARKEDTLAIIEVKTRTGTSLPNVLQVMNRAKRERLIKAADHFILSKDLRVETRFDIIWVTRKKRNLQLEHIENAFYCF